MLREFFWRVLDKIIDAWLGFLGWFNPGPFGKDLQPYWIRRREIFSLFDKDIQTDEAGLFSATPEKIANQIAKSFRVDGVVDAFCGIGATAIAFARAGQKVYAIDISVDRLKMARHNASLYNVEDKITFIADDFLNVSSGLNAEGVFLDPPWGGVDYAKIQKFSLNDFNPDGKILLDFAFQNFKKVALRVPRQFNFAELAQFNKPYIIQPNKIRSKLYSYSIFFE